MREKEMDGIETGVTSDHLPDWTCIVNKVRRKSGRMGSGQGGWEGCSVTAAAVVHLRTDLPSPPESRTLQQFN